MKTYLRLLNFAKPLGRFATIYLALSIIGVIFSLLNFGMAIPLLDTLFSNIGEEERVIYSSLPEFNFSTEYFKGVFYYYFYFLIDHYGKSYALYFICLIIVLSNLSANTARYFSVRMFEGLKAKVVKKIRLDFYDHIIHLHTGYFTDQRKGDIMSRASADVLEVENLITKSIGSFLKEPFMIIGVFIVLIKISPELTVFSLLTLPISGGIIGFINKRLKVGSKRLQESMARIIGMFDETLGGMKVIKAFTAENYLFGRFEEENTYYQKQFKSLANKRELASPLAEVMGVVVVAIVLFYGGTLVLQDNSALGASEFIAYLAIFSQVLQPSKNLSKAMSSVQKGLVAGERVLEVIDTPSLITDKENAKKLEKFEDKISLEDIRFAYGDHEVIKGVSLDIPKGKTVALVGPSGGGKSTISDLIPRFFDVKSGHVKVDGVDVRDYQIKSLRSHMGIVTQESILFNDSVINNIAFGSDEIDEARVIEAAKIANAHEFISKMEDGYHTVIGDRGGKLSGGQRQRLSIARAIYRNPDILILDEATSALDTESEKLVQEAISKLMENRTSLVIAHRLSTIQDADEIVVVKDGEIVERGTHHELVQKEDGVYNKLQKMQAL